jgi:hypothetical protein
MGRSLRLPIKTGLVPLAIAERKSGEKGRSAQRAAKSESLNKNTESHRSGGPQKVAKTVDT